MVWPTSMHSLSGVAPTLLPSTMTSTSPSSSSPTWSTAVSSWMWTVYMVFECLAVFSVRYQHWGSLTSKLLQWGGACVYKVMVGVYHFAGAALCIFFDCLVEFLKLATASTRAEWAEDLVCWSAFLTTANLAAWFRSVAMIVSDYDFRFIDAQVFKLFKGLDCSGAWCCFDGFNGLFIEVLTVIAQQFLVLFGRAADMKYYNDTATMEFEETNITMKPTFNAFITMSPGHVGRAELPDNLAALFRFVVIMVPDFALIGQSMFYAYGFTEAQVFKLFKGLDCSGAWCCFDGFNGLLIEVLSAIAQQFLVLFVITAASKYCNDTATMEFEETHITMKPTFNVFITLTPAMLVVLS